MGSVRGVRWADLFADLEGQLIAAESAELAAEVTDRTRRETALLRLVDRLRAAVGREVTVTVSGAGPLRGRVASVGPDWLLLAGPGETLVPLGPVVSVSGLGPWSAAPGSEGEVTARLDLRYALRALARDRARVVATLSDDRVIAGTVDRVGADFVEVTSRPEGTNRQADADVHVVPLSALVVVRSD